MAQNGAGQPIFISYRRADRHQFAEPFFDHLADWFGPDVVFLDRKDIDLGAAFPDELDHAIRSAKVVLVLITPQWLPELNRRKNGADVDYVRREVRLALELAALDRTRLIVPVVWQTSMMSRSDLPDDVADIVERNAAVLPVASTGQPSDWGDTVLKLRWKIAEVTGLLPAPKVADAIVWNDARERLKGVLERPHMRTLVDAGWGPDPLGSHDHGRLVKVLADLLKALKVARSTWALVPGSLAEAHARSAGCLEALSIPCSLFINRRVARHWRDLQDSPGAVPVQYAGTAALVHSSAMAWPIRLCSEWSERDGFRMERALDIGLPDVGIGKHRQADVHATLWKARNATPYPTPGEPLDKGRLQALRDELDISAMADEPFLLTGVIGPGRDAFLEFVALGAELGIPAIGRIDPSGVPEADSGVLHHRESRLGAAIKLCLEEIRKLP
ncbi:toll/interleukin-1 receptor domain-containing protein [uncultured Sphaerotilus sp.]|uniref:toll/interleukin-1 receptor domain-containing protein n=1 Tax=uncultured Sphaerotilus sp. TaxID=474984 RepID=UPI0030CA4E57